MSKEAKNGAKLIKAAQKGNVKTVKSLLKKGVSMECKDSDGKTALHHAAENDKIDMLRFLVDYKVDIDAQDRFGMTPLLRSVMAKKEQAAFFLIKSGANPDIPSNHGLTVWDRAEQMLSKSTAQRMRSEASLQRSKNPRVYHYQEPTANDVKWGDNVINVPNTNTSSSAPAPSPSPASAPSPTPSSPSPVPAPSLSSASSSAASVSSSPSPSQHPPSQPQPTVQRIPSQQIMQQMQQQPPQAFQQNSQVPGQQIARPVSNSFRQAPMQQSQQALVQEQYQASPQVASAAAMGGEINIEEIVEAVSLVAMGASSAHFGENDVDVLNSSLRPLAAALRGLNYVGDGELAAACRRVGESVSGFAQSLRNLNEDPTSLGPYRAFSDVTKRLVSSTSALVLSTGPRPTAPRVAARIQDTALATKALLQASLSPVSDVALLKAARLSATNAMQLVKEISNFMLEVGRLDIQGRVGEVGWVVGRVMEGLLISSKTAFASPSDPATRANLAALAKALAEQYHKITDFTGRPMVTAGDAAVATVNEAVHYSAALKQLSAAAARFSAAAATSPLQREKQVSAFCNQLVTEINGLKDAAEEPMDGAAVMRTARSVVAIVGSIVAVGLNTAYQLSAQDPTLAQQISLAMQTAVYFGMHVKLAASIKAVRVQEPRNQAGLPHAIRSLVSALSLIIETRLF